MFVTLTGASQGDSLGRGLVASRFAKGCCNGLLTREDRSKSQAR